MGTSGSAVDGICDNNELQVVYIFEKIAKSKKKKG